MTTLTLPAGMSIERLARRFGLTTSGIYAVIGKGRFPIPTFRSGKRRYADPRIVRDYFAAKRAEGLATLEGAATGKTGET
jgi:hypothetical protein